MHQLAVALKDNGHEVTGSDDHIFEPSLSILKQHGLLPESTGWHPERVTADIDAVLLGMHARKDNPELQKARELNLKVYAFPDFIYEHARDKQRIVVAGSHGKTTVTSIMVHVLSELNMQADYLAGAVPSPGMPSVRLSEDAPIMIIEGDEYTTSALDLQPKFLKYHHHIGIITGIAWDHINVFPSFNTYYQQFVKFAENSCKAGTLVYCNEDLQVKKLIKSAGIPEDVVLQPYGLPKHVVKDGLTWLKDSDGNLHETGIFGDHNLLNLEAARLVLLKLGVRNHEFYKAVKSFKGASLRMNLLGSKYNTRVFRDFAHAPSKVQATVAAVKKQFPRQAVTACLELHTFSSLTKDFLPQYAGTMQLAEQAVVYYNPEVFERKKLQPFTPDDLKAAFEVKNLRVFTSAQALQGFLLQQKWQEHNLLLMSSANFGGLDLNELAKKVLGLA